MDKPDILKSGAVVLNSEGKLLIVKPKDKDFWIFVGGKIEDGETPEQALEREVIEELNVRPKSSPVFYMESPIEPAAGDKQGRTIQIKAFLVELDGEPEPSSEIEQLHWLSKDEFQGSEFLLGSVLAKHVVPKLINEGLIN